MKDIEIKDETLRIIEDDTSQQVQELLEERAKYGLNNDSEYTVDKIKKNGISWINCRTESIRI